MKALTRILFEKDGLCEGIRLFKSQADLAREILAIKKSEPHTAQARSTEQKLVNIRAYINQVLKRRRTCSDNLRCLIVQAVSRRLPLTVDHGLAEARLNEALDSFAASDFARDKLDDSFEEFVDLRMEGEKAGVHFILNFQPAELTQGPRASALTEELVERLRLTGPLGEISQPKRYIFYLSARIVAERFWLNLHLFLGKKGLSSFEASERLQKASVGDAPALVVNTVDPVLCVHPTVVYDPEQQERRGFTLYYHPEEKVSVARMSQESVALWYHHHYLPLTTYPKRFGVEPVRWVDVQHLV